MIDIREKRKLTDTDIYFFFDNLQTKYKFERGLGVMSTEYYLTIHGDGTKNIRGFDWATKAEADKCPKSSNPRLRFSIKERSFLDDGQFKSALEFFKFFCKKFNLRLREYPDQKLGYEAGTVFEIGKEKDINKAYEMLDFFTSRVYSIIKRERRRGVLKV